MGGFFGWFVVVVVVLAVFNAEKLPELKSMIEEKFKSSVDVAKESSKIAKSKIKQVKTDMETKKLRADKDDDDDESPEDIEESMKFMGDYLNKENKTKVKKKIEPEPVAEPTKPEEQEEPEEEKPIDLEHRY